MLIGRCAPQGFVHSELYGWHRVQHRIRAQRELQAEADTHPTHEGHEHPVHKLIRYNSKRNIVGAEDADAPTRQVDLWVGSIPDHGAYEQTLREAFSSFGAVESVFLRRIESPRGHEGEHRSWCYIKYTGDEANMAHEEAVRLALLRPVTLPDAVGRDSSPLRVRRAEKVHQHIDSLDIWSSLPGSSRQLVIVPTRVMISANDEDAQMLLYEICFTGLHARYEEMAEKQLISLRTLDRLKESLKKGQDTLVNVRTSQHSESLPDPIYLAWYERSSASVRDMAGAHRSFVVHKHKGLLNSVKNFVLASTHERSMSTFQFQNVEDLMMCAEMAWAVWEAHVEVSQHVLRGEIVNSRDPHIAEARRELEDELGLVVTEAQEVLRTLHLEHFSLMQLVHTVIAGRAALSLVHAKINGMMHKGFFELADQEALQDNLENRMLELEDCFKHSALESIGRSLRSRMCHKHPSPPPKEDPAFLVQVNAAQAAAAAARGGVPGEPGDPLEPRSSVVQWGEDEMRPIPGRAEDDEAMEPSVLWDAHSPGVQLSPQIPVGQLPGQLPGQLQLPPLQPRGLPGQPTP